MSKYTVMMALALVAIVVVLVGSQVLGNHSDPKISPEAKVAQGVYDPEATIFAQTEIEKELANVTLLNQDSKGLAYLAYLAEGALCFPDKVDSFKVRMLANAAQGPLDSVKDKDLTNEQIFNLNRVKTAIDATSHQAETAKSGGITSASVSLDGNQKSSPVETSCR